MKKIKIRDDYQFIIVMLISIILVMLYATFKSPNKDKSEKSNKTLKYTIEYINGDIEYKDLTPDHRLNECGCVESKRNIEFCGVKTFKIWGIKK